MQCHDAKSDPETRSFAPMVLFASALLVVLCTPLAACGQRSGRQTLQVTATAYTSQQVETRKGNISPTAWGGHLHPGMKAIAVSQDLIKLGLRHDTKVKIDGLKGTYTVRDKMAKRWKRKIDIYMGSNIHKANAWGEKKVTIHWTNPEK